MRMLPPTVLFQFHGNISFFQVEHEFKYFDDDDDDDDEEEDD